ncbi:hypothetical protein [Flavobacterium faecale]|uniref:hypothetical protein n=1 Tax=Flavobacterium faecale TaxID=1355330 RepID=UPI003AAD8B4B
MNKNGGYQIIPFYVLWILFSEGYSYSNTYGENPKEKFKKPASPPQNDIKIVKNTATEQLTQLGVKCYCPMIKKTA